MLSEQTTFSLNSLSFGAVLLFLMKVLSQSLYVSRSISNLRGVKYVLLVAMVNLNVGALILAFCGCGAEA